VTPIVWSRQADADLTAIHDYIAHDSAYYARITVDRIITATDRLPKWPRSGRIVPEVDNEDLRELLVGSYRVVYRLHPDAIGIVTVVHQAREFRLSEGAV
jgi:plasmid stabilization system protein ParE